MNMFTNNLAEFSRFRESKGPYSDKDILPTDFWNKMRSIKGAGAFARIVLPVVSFPQGSCAVERSFSPIRDIHTSKRNRLDRDRLAKLVYVKFNREWEKRNSV